MTPFKYLLLFLIFSQTSLIFAVPRYNPEAARLYDAGLRALTRGEQEKAQAALEEAVVLDASLSDAYCVLGLIYNGFEQFRDAAKGSFSVPPWLMKIILRHTANSVMSC